MGKGSRKKKTAPPIQRTEAVRPTPQRLARGSWAMPSGMGKHEAPAVDIAADMIGRLLAAQKITSGQEQAARHYQRLRASYLAELPDISGYKSCLSGDIPGFDDGDGDPDIIEAYRAMERELGHRGRREMLWVCEENNRPTSIETLRWALDVIEGM